MSGDDTLSRIVGEFGAALAPLETAVSSPAAFSGLVRDLGFAFVGAVPAPIAALGSSAADLAALVESFADGSPSIAQLETLQSKIRAVVAAVRALEHAAPGTFPAELEAAGFASEFAARLIDFLIITHLQRNHPRVETILRVLGVVRVALVPAAGARPAYVSRTLALPDIGDLLRDPSLVLTRLYGWGTLDFRFHDFLENVADLLSDFGLDVYLHELNPRLASALQPAAPPSNAVRWSLKAPLFVGGTNGASAEVGVGLFGLSAQGSHLPGLSLLPYAEGAVQESVQLTDVLTLTVDADADLTAGIGVVVRPNEPLDILTDLIPSAASGVAPPSGAKLRVGLDASAQGGGPTTLVGVDGVGALVVNAVSIVGAAHVSSAGTPDVGVELTFKGARFQSSSARGDSFVQSVLPSSGAPVGFDLTLGLSAARGFYFGGGAALQATIPVQLSFAGVTFQAIVVGVTPADGTVALEIGATFGAGIGPLSASVQNVGLRLVFSFPAGGGDLGPLAIAAGFKSPSGVGLSIDTAGLAGGGFLSHNDTTSTYAGMLQLAYQQFQLQAFGLIATKLPTGPGYSLIAMIDANFPPIELVAGFTLNGVGGLLGINRTISIDALEAAIKAKTLSNFLFAKNPVANAAQLLTDLDTFFPAAQGRYVFGPLLQIGWGGRAVTIDLALILELPDPVRLVLIGELAVFLPDPDEKLVELHMDVLGTMDFGTDEGSLDAVLHDSHIMSYPLQGAMAFRGCWAGGDKSTFLLSIGGFHPKFQPPPGFPALQRLSISMPSGHISKLNLEGYLAVSSNTLQIGAKLDIFVGVDGFGLAGNLNFDTLIERHPFHFDGDISGSVTLSAGGDDIMSVGLTANLTGPAPWHCAGSAHFSVFGFGVSKSFSTTFGDDAPALPTTLVDVGAAIRAALSDPHNFTATLIANENGLVTLRTPTVSGVVLGHPGATLKVDQKICPLGLTIQKFGAGAPAGDTLFAITLATVDGAAQSPTPITDEFAPAQFLNLSDDDELAAPSFEAFASGVALGDGALANGPILSRPVVYETWRVDTPGGTPVPDAGYTPPFDRLSGIRTALRNSGRLRYAMPAQPMVRAATLDFVVATTDQIAASGIGAGTGQTFAQARAALAAAIAQNPDQRGALQVVPHYEVAA